MNTLVKRCLTYGVIVLPYRQYGVFKLYDKYKIPDDVLESFKKEDLEKYVKGLYLSSMEMARDWVSGHDTLKELGFVEKERQDGHRVFVSLVWVGK